MSLFLLFLACFLPTQSTECQWNYGIPTAINQAHNGNDRRQLIVNGDTANANEYPWHVDLPMGCGGTLIGREWVLTAAHCFENPPLDSLKIDNAGDPKVRFKDRSIVKTALAVHIHEMYDNESQAVKADIALIRIEPLDCAEALSSGISAIKMLDDSNGFDFDGCTAFLVGYGALFSAAAVPSEMLEVITKIHKYSTCNLFPAMILGEHIIDDSQVCTFAEGTNEDTCQGDSGGPLYIDIDTSPTSHLYVDVGVVSYGSGCGNSQAGVYTKISSYKSWIQGHFADAPFQTATSCDKGDYNEGPVPDNDQMEDLQYTPQPLYNDLTSHVNKLNSCEIKYLTQIEPSQLVFGTKWDTQLQSPGCTSLPNCKVCWLDWNNANGAPGGCLTCEEGYEVQLPIANNDNYLGRFNREMKAEDFCTGTCVRTGTNNLNNQASTIANFYCSADSCLTRLSSSGTLGDFKIEGENPKSMILPTNINPNTVPVSFNGKNSCNDKRIQTQSVGYYIPNECVHDPGFNSYARAECVSESEMKVKYYSNQGCPGSADNEITYTNRGCLDDISQNPKEFIYLGAPCGGNSSPVTESPTPMPTKSPTPMPTHSPTPVPTNSPTPVSTPNPTPMPTNSPTPVPTRSPTPMPTKSPTPAPTQNPTPAPTHNTTPESDTNSPTKRPTQDLTKPDTKSPTRQPTKDPVNTPSNNPTENSATPRPVTNSPTPSPTDSPTPVPTQNPTPRPTPEPSNEPTTSKPTSPGETRSPTKSPTTAPTPSPVITRTSDPTVSPTFNPTTNPTNAAVAVVTFQQRLQIYNLSLNKTQHYQREITEHYADAIGVHISNISIVSITETPNSHVNILYEISATSEKSNEVKQEVESKEFSTSLATQIRAISGLQHQQVSVSAVNIIENVSKSDSDSADKILGIELNVINISLAVGGLIILCCCCILVILKCCSSSDDSMSKQSTIKYAEPETFNFGVSEVEIPEVDKKRKPTPIHTLSGGNLSDGSSLEQYGPERHAALSTASDYLGMPSPREGVQNQISYSERVSWDTSHLWGSKRNSDVIA